MCQGIGLGREKTANGGVHKLPFLWHAEKNWISLWVRKGSYIYPKESLLHDECDLVCYTKGQHSWVTNRTIRTHNGQFLSIIAADVYMLLSVPQLWFPHSLSNNWSTPTISLCLRTAVASGDIALAGQSLWALFSFYSAELSPFLLAWTEARFPINQGWVPNFFSQTTWDKNITYLDLVGIWGIAEGEYNHVW